jgi:hypothetical protein
MFEASEAGSVLCGTAFVLGAAVATFSVDKLGRKVSRDDGINVNTLQNTRHNTKKILVH